MSWEDIAADTIRALPVVLLCAAALVVVFVDWFVRPERSYFVGIIALVGLVISGGVLAKSGMLRADPAKVFGERMVIDPLGAFFAGFFILAALATVVVSLRTRGLQGRRVGEYYALLLIATAAMTVVVFSRDFLLLYLGIETLSLSSYVLVGYYRRERLGTEASLKYLLYGSVASGLMLFGISYLYGLTGTLEMPRIYGLEVSAVGSAPTARTAAFGAGWILLLAGLGFKMALVPFHSWCPDVYEGAPTPITAYLSVASKAAGFAAILRIVYPLFCMDHVGREMPAIVQSIRPWTIFWVLSAATMTLGNLVAIWQTNVKRLLAYSSIAHAGYIAMALTLLSEEAFEAMIVYLVVYLVMNLGAFFTVLFVENATGRCDLAAYRGMVRRSPLLATVLTIFLLSLLGIPPTAGFLAKFKLFGALIHAATRPAVALAVIGIVNIVISAYYYMKVVKAMVFDQGEDESPIATNALDGAVLVVFAVAVFAIFVVWTPVQRLAETVPLNLTVF